MSRFSYTKTVSLGFVSVMALEQFHCGAPATQAQTTSVSTAMESSGGRTSTDDGNTRTVSTGNTIANAQTVPVTQPVATGDAPEISRSVGVAGGVVVMWPRVSPRTDDPQMRAIALRLQQHISDVVARAVPGRPVDVRPEPERVCPRQGCTGMTVGAALSHNGRGACVVVALVSGPGTAPAELVPWAGRMQLRSTSVPFRQPPESQIVVDDFRSCATVIDDLATHDQDVITTIQRLAR